MEAKPDKDVAMLLSQLSLQLPTGSKRVQNVVEKKDWFSINRYLRVTFSDNQGT
jgi:hypothetical protein